MSVPLCTTSVCSLSTHLIKRVHFVHVSCAPQKKRKEKCCGRPRLLTDIGPPCVPWCATQVADAQYRLVVHNVVLYP